MKKLILAALGSVSALVAAAPAQSAVLVPGASNITFDDFATIAGTQGDLLASMFASDTDTEATPIFGGTIRSAVYRNTLGTLDFYYQVVHGTGDGVDEMTVSPFAGFLVDAYFWDADSDGAGIFTAENNGGNTAGDSFASRRSVDNGGRVLSTVFTDSIASGQTSSTYIFRTDATVFGLGRATGQDGGIFGVDAFAPVPEPATWAMMLVGFGAVGYSMRRRPKYRLVQAV